MARVACFARDSAALCARSFSSLCAGKTPSISNNTVNDNHVGNSTQTPKAQAGERSERDQSSCHQPARCRAPPLIFGRSPRQLAHIHLFYVGLWP